MWEPGSHYPVCLWPVFSSATLPPMDTLSHDLVLDTSSQPAAPPASLSLCGLPPSPGLALTPSTKLPSQTVSHCAALICSGSAQSSPLCGHIRHHAWALTHTPSHPFMWSPSLGFDSCPLPCSCSNKLHQITFVCETLLTHHTG